MAEALQEFVDSSGTTLRVDPKRGVLRGVKLIGLTSRNGRVYQPTALRKAQALYEGAKVNVNHPKTGPLSPRDYQDRLGVIREVQFREGEGLFGDLHFNPKHPLAEQLVWDAEHNPRNVGVSHNVLARVTHEGKSTTVEEITHVQSVDLVADSASTHGLYEHEEVGPKLERLTLNQLRQLRPDLLHEHSLQETERLGQELSEVVSRCSALQRQQRVLRLLCEHGLRLSSERQETDEHRSSRQHAISPAFFEMLLGVENNQQLEQLVAERLELIGMENSSLQRDAYQSPRCMDQLALQDPISGGSETASQFAKSLQRIGT